MNFKLNHIVDDNTYSVITSYNNYPEEKENNIQPGRYRAAAAAAVVVFDTFRETCTCNSVINNVGSKIYYFFII